MTARITWTRGEDSVYRIELPDGRRLWVWRSEPGVWHYGLNHTGFLGDVPNDFTAPTLSLAKADVVAMAGRLHVTCRLVRLMRGGKLCDLYAVHPVSGEGADAHNARKAPVSLNPAAALVAAVAEPVDPATEDGAAYADRQMAAYGVTPARWASYALTDAYAHLIASGTYPEHADRIAAELANRDAPEVPDAELLALCVRLGEMQAEWQRLYDATSDAPDLTTPADHAWQDYSHNVWPSVRRAVIFGGSKPRDPADLPARLHDLPATTPEGREAKAAAILALDDAAGYCDSRDDICQLYMAMARDVAGAAYRPLGDGCAGQGGA